MGFLAAAEGVTDAGPLVAGRLPVGAGAAAAAPAMVVEVCDNLDGLAALEPDWRRLEKTWARATHVFQGFDWCNAWARTRAGDHCMDLCIVTVRLDDRLALVWPLMKVCTGPLCVLRWLSDPYSQYGDVLVDGDAGREAVLAAAWAHIRALPGIDAIRLRHVRSDATVAAFLSRHCRPSGATDSAPCLDLTRYPDEAAYEKRYTKAQRRRRKRIRRELEERGALDFRLLAAGPEFDGLVDRTITEKRRWLAERGLHSLPLDDPHMAGFIRDLARGRMLKVTLAVLSRGEEPIAYEIGLRYGRHHFGYITAHDTRLTDASPARLHMDLSQRRAIADGLRCFDLMVPGDPHKQSWSDASVAVFDFYRSATIRGWLYGLVYLEGLRPLMRAAYHAAPSGVRRRFKRLAVG